ncbi:MAG: carboxypeptidase regulatory-like domain-containing protein [Bryobacterales bacterium]|nr:carboxypeptidase regulatory-like domain-containing protein [Bryobacterales bacterium]
MRSRSVLATLALFAAPHLLAQGAEPEAVQGLIRGKVFDADSGAGVGEATVSAIQMRGAGRSQVVTNSSGEFEIRVTISDRYRLQVDAPGFAEPSDPESLFPWVEVDKRKPAVSRDLPVHRNSTISGRLVDADSGEAATRFRVQALRAYWTQGERGLMPTGSSLTLPDGSFRIPDLPPGEYFVEITPQPGIRLQAGMPATIPKPETGYEYLVLPRGSVDWTTPVLLSSGSTYDFGVVKSKKIPLARAKVTAISPECRGGMHARAERWRKGLYALLSRLEIPCDGPPCWLLGLRPGRYPLAAMEMDFRTYGLTFVEVIEPQEGAEPIPVALRVHRAITLNGTVILDRSGRTPDEAGPVPEGLRVMISPREGPGSPIPPPTVRSGRFSLPAQARIPSRVVILGMRDTHYGKQITYNGVPLRANEIEINPESLVQEMVVVLSDQPATFRGRVMDGENGAAGVSVFLVPWPFENRWDALVRVATDESGRFEKRGLSPGEYRAVVARGSERSIHAPGVLVGLAASGGEVKLEGGQSVNIALTKPK